MKIDKIRKRDGRVLDFDKTRITEVIFRAAYAVGGQDRQTAEKLSDKVVRALEKSGDPLPDVEQIQDAVEKILIEEGHAKTAKAYILYRQKRAEMRLAAAEAAQTMDEEKIALADMFAHKSKLASLIGYDRIEAYKNLLLFLKEQIKSGKLPVSNDYLGGSELATNIYYKKYYLKDLNNNRIEKRPEDVFCRMAAFMAAVEPDSEKQVQWAEKYYLALYEGWFLPGGRVIAGAGDLYRLKTMANCFVSVIDEDNIESIYKTAYECARTYSYGGGIGVDISVLRPRDSVVHNAADNSTGSVSFMEIYSLTTGLIGQSARRGALMLTIDVKHPDAPLFVNVKKIPNWVTQQIVEQCKWSGKFSDDQLREIQRQVRENTQVRFANISLKVSDEFMRAVEEQTTYGPTKIIVYKKDKEVSGLGVVQTGKMHYSFSIPSKPIGRYELEGTFNSIEELNDYLASRDLSPVTAEELEDINARDMFGDFVIPFTDDFDLAVKFSGDFMLYFNCRETGEIKRLIKARELWNSFVEGNYRTAEPGLIFWSTMSKYSPSNYVGRPIASTNPCVAGSSKIETDIGIMTIKEISEKYSDGLKVAVDSRMLQSSGLMLRGKLFLPISAALKTGEKDTVKIKTRKGFELICTPDHKIMTNYGWVRAGELTERHEVFVNSESDVILDVVESVVYNGLEEVYDIQEPLTHSFIANGIVVHNCGEVPLEDGGACNLGSINLSRFVIDGYADRAEIDWASLKEATATLTRFLDAVVIWNELLNPLEKQRRAAAETRRLGLGVMGIADMLNQLGMEYDSDSAIELCEQIGGAIANAAYSASAELAEEKGPSPIFEYESYSRCPFFKETLDIETKELIRKKGLRNIAILSIAPTGTISSVVLSYRGDKNYIGVSGGVEPIFALYYTRRSESFGNQIFKIFHSTVAAYIDKYKLMEKAQESNEEELQKILPKHFFRTAHYIEPAQRVRIQGIWQKYIDHSISSTVNLPEDIDPETISSIYLDAWRHRLKGITIYRAGSRYPILAAAEERNEFQQYKDKLFEVQINGSTAIMHGDDFLTMPNGALTTVYHAMKSGMLRVESEEEITKVIAVEW